MRNPHLCKRYCGFLISLRPLRVTSVTKAQCDTQELW